MMRNVRRNFWRDTTDLRVLSAIRDDLLSPEALAFIQQEIKKIVHSRAQDTAASIDDARARVSSLDREIENLTNAVAAAGWSQALGERLAKTETERDRLRNMLSSRPACPDYVPNVLTRLKTMIADLSGTLKRHPEHARQALREDIGAIPLVQEGNEVFAEIGIRADRVLLAAGGTFYGFGSGGLHPGKFTTPPLRIELR